MSELLKGRNYGTSSPELRLVLLGNIGCGKTSSADNILGQLSPASHRTSRSCQLRTAITEGRSVTVVEAPRWYWSGGKMEEGVRKETQQAMTLVAPGPHAILLLVPVNQFTEMDNLVPAELEDLFGEEALSHTIVLLTCGDYLMGETVEQYLQKEHPGLGQVIKRCGGRYHVINNRQRQNREQVWELLGKVDDMVSKNGVCYTKTAQERELEQRVKDRKRELLESYRAQKEQRKEAVASTHIPQPETQRGVEDSTAFERWRRDQREEIGESVAISQRSNGLHSTPAPQQHSSSEPHNDGQPRTSSFRLNKDGAVLSQMSEVKSPKVVTTFHHRVNSFEDRSPEASPTASTHSLVFSSSPTFPSSPVLLTSPAPPSSFTASSSTPSPSELRLVIIGRSGAGKSAAGNNILGRKEFECCPESLTAVTQACEKKKALVKGRQVAVVDTPDWFNSEQTPEEVRAQISSCVALSSPGPHAFLLCVPLDQPAKTEMASLEALEAVFGPDAVQRHTLPLFTYVDKLRASDKAGKAAVEAYIAGQRGDLLKIVEKCRDRFHVMEQGGDGGDRGNVEELLEKVEQMVKEAGGKSYSNPAFHEAENIVRQRQVEIARERRSGTPEQDRPLSSERWGHYPYMQPVAEAEEEVREEELEQTRDEAEMSVRTMNIESLPPITRSTMSPSLLRSIMEKMQTTAKMLPKLLEDSSEWAGEGAKKLKGSEVWGKVGSGAQNVHQKLRESSVWGKVGAGAGHVSKLVGDRVPKVVVDSSAWVGSGAKSVAASPMWGKVGSGAKTGAKLMAESSVQVGAGIGAGAKKVAQSPVWGKMGSGAKAGAKAGAKIVAESPVWEKIVTAAKQVPMVVIGGALLGLVLGVVLAGVIGGAVGTAAGSVVTEVGRRKFRKGNALEKTDEATRNVERMADDSIDSLLKNGEKVLKTE
ncbi:GTPase IMAP family member 8 [Spinachia spinachia]